MHEPSLDRTSGRLSLRTLLGYGSSMIGLMGVTTMAAVHLMFFYNTVIMLPAAVVALVMALAQVWDAITDPVIGYVSDRTPWKWGRRRPYILLGSVPTVVFFFLVFSPPASLSDRAAAVFFAAVFLLFFTFRTVWDTPYCALAPELTLDYDERTRVSGYQQVFGTVGDILGTMAPLVLVGIYLTTAPPSLSVTALRNTRGLAAKLRTPEDPVCLYIRVRLSDETKQLLEEYQPGTPAPRALRRALVEDLNQLLTGKALYDKERFDNVVLRDRTKDLLEEEDLQGKDLMLLNRLLLEDAFPHGMKRLERTGWSVVGALVGVLALASALWTYLGTRENPNLAKASKLPLVASLRATFSNRPYLLLVVTCTFAGMSNYTTIAVVQYVIKYWFKAPKATPFFFGAFFIGVFAAIPIWMKVTTRMGKKSAYILAMLVYSVILWTILVLPRGALVPFGGLMFLAGAFNIGLWLISCSIVPDIIEWDQIRVGERREGAYYGVWTLVRKAAIGGAYIIIGLVLTWVGFSEEAADQEQTASALLGMRLLAGPIPSILLIIGAIVFLKFPITKAVHRDMLRQIAERRDRQEED